MVDTRQETEREQLLGAEAGELDLWSTDDSKGWNRLSITRKPPRPALNPDDLLLPSGLGNLRMLVACTGMGVLATFLYVWVPVMLVNFFVPVPGIVLAAVLGGAFLALTVGLYLWGTVETQRDRELGGRL
jgi:TM2 domain-containing membrane protein YozV